MIIRLISMTIMRSNADDRCETLRMSLLSTHCSVDTGVCEQKHSSGEEHGCENKCSEHQIRGWIAVSAAGLHSKGLRKRSVVFADTGFHYPKYDNVCSKPFLPQQQNNFGSCCPYSRALGFHVQ